MGLTTLLYEDGQTPLDEDEKEGLLLPSVTTREELNEVEQRNIEEAIRWTIGIRRRLSPEKILTEHFVLEIHQRMFGEVWKWAGTFRRTNKNIGVDKYSIPLELRTLMDDCKFWISHNTFPADEVALRFKHRLVSIHCFANGNGRHSRLMADIIIEKLLNQSIFTWGSVNLIHTGVFRSNYLTALREADHENYKPLLLFARS